MKRVVIIGAGIGGLTTAAVLARSGLEVTVLEGHVYPGGCAGTFYHQGYKFDAGATLAGGFYRDGPMDLVAKATGVKAWPARTSQPAMAVHLPDGSQVLRWGDDQRFGEYLNAFGDRSERFWRWQEAAADALWDLALRLPEWPPQSPAQLLDLLRKGTAWAGLDPRRRLSPGLLLDALRPLSYHLHGQSEKLRLFVDAQLLISAQVTSQRANALYGASALDLPRRGVVHLEGGMGAISETLVQALRQNGGEIVYRNEATKIVLENHRPVAVESRRLGSLPADAVVINLPPWNISKLLGDDVPARLRRLPQRPITGWGAFVLYLGVDANIMSNIHQLHHQLILGEPLGEGNSLFVSVSPDWDSGRAPAGHRAVTVSTHTNLGQWWDLFQHDPAAYEKRKQEYTRRILTALEHFLPGISGGADLILPGTPISFERFTRRAWGWVGGFPQVNLLQVWGPRLAPNIWMVGDSIFPGQSTAAVALGGMRVAEDVRTALLQIPEQRFEGTTVHTLE